MERTAWTSQTMTRISTFETPSVHLVHSCIRPRASHNNLKLTDLNQEPILTFLTPSPYLLKSILPFEPHHASAQNEKIS